MNLTADPYRFCRMNPALPRLSTALTILLATLALSGLGLLAGRLAASTRLRFAGAALMACTFLLLLFPEANGVLVRLLEGAQ